MKSETFIAVGCPGSDRFTPVFSPAGSCRHQQALFRFQISVKRYLEVIEILKILYVPSSVHTYTDRERKLLFLFSKGRLQLVFKFYCIILCIM